MNSNEYMFPYSSVAEKLADKIQSNPDGFMKLQGKTASSFTKFSGAEIGRFLSDKHGRKRIRIILSLFGMYFTENDIIEISVTKNEVVSLVKQIKPVIKYMSSKFLDRIAHCLGRDISEKIETVKGYSKKKELTEFLMSNVSEFSIQNVERMEENDSKEPEEKANVIAALKQENSHLRKTLEKTNTSSGIDALLVERIQESIDEIVPELKFVKEKWNGESTFKANIGATAVLHVSDWHIGAKENVDGFNEFNYRIACDRVKLLTEKMIGWTNMHRAMYNISELVILATGDMISGDIHEELIRTNEFSVPEQCVKASMLFSKMVQELSAHFKKVRVEYIVADNHSRTTKKIQFADGTNSYNYIVGTMSKLMLQNNTDVQFNLYPEIKQIVKVEELRYLITHGNCVRGGAYGIPYYSLKRTVGAEAIARMNLENNAHFDKLVMGHYHIPMRDIFCEMTGCLSSTTAFDHAAGRYCKACQTAWVVSKDNEIDFCEFWLS